MAHEFAHLAIRSNSVEILFLPYWIALELYDVMNSFLMNKALSFGKNNVILKVMEEQN